MLRLRPGETVHVADVRGDGGGIAHESGRAGRVLGARQDAEQGCAKAAARGAHAARRSADPDAEAIAAVTACALVRHDDPHATVHRGADVALRLVRLGTGAVARGDGEPLGGPALLVPGIIREAAMNTSQTAPPPPSARVAHVSVPSTH